MPTTLTLIATALVALTLLTASSSVSAYVFELRTSSTGYLYGSRGTSSYSTPYWYYICGSGGLKNLATAQKICSLAGFTASKTTYESAYDSAAGRNTKYTDVECPSTAMSFDDCTYRKLYSGCASNYKMMLRCSGPVKTTSTSTAAGIYVGGSGNYFMRQRASDGVIEVRKTFSTTWGAVSASSTSYDQTSSLAVCRFLGYQAYGSAAAVSAAPPLAWATQDKTVQAGRSCTLRNFYCSSTTPISLSSCSYTTTTSSSYPPLSINCQPTQISIGGMWYGRYVQTNTSSASSPAYVLQIRPSIGTTAWGGFCRRANVLSSSTEASAYCRLLQFNQGGTFASASSSSSSSSGSSASNLAFLTNVSCTGSIAGVNGSASTSGASATSVSSISQCHATTWTNTNAPPSGCNPTISIKCTTGSSSSGPYGPPSSSSSSTSSSKKPVGVVVGGAIGSLAMIICCVVLIVVITRRRSRYGGGAYVAGSRYQQFPLNGMQQQQQQGIMMMPQVGSPGMVAGGGGGQMMMMPAGAGGGNIQHQQFAMMQSPGGAGGQMMMMPQQQQQQPMMMMHGGMGDDTPPPPGYAVPNMAVDAGMPGQPAQPGYMPPPGYQ